MRERVHQAVVKAITNVQEVSGRQSDSVSGDTCPLGGLSGFESLNAVEATVAVSGEIGRELPLNIMLPKPGEQLSVNDIVDRIMNHVEGYGSG